MKRQTKRQMGRKKANVAPFGVIEFINPTGTTAWRVQGVLNGERIRKNFVSSAEAIEFCNAKNAEAGVLMDSPQALARTRLSSADLVAAEHAVDKAAGRWTHAEQCEAGFESMLRRVKSEPVLPLALQWFDLVRGEVNLEWAKDLRQRVRYFLADNPTLTTDQFTQAQFREWLDGLDVGQQSKANIRNCVHRFAGWLVERGKLTANPAAGLRLKKSAKAARGNIMPSVLSAAQAAALFRACDHPETRRLKGWLVLCLFTGLRPGGKTDSGEAPLLQWSEINFKSGELSLHGRKRGAKVRIFKLHEQALAWLREVKKDGEDRPGQFWRHLRRRAVDFANTELAAKGEPLISWDSDILRHTYASICASEGMSVDRLAAQMGTSTSMIYAHYRHPRTESEVMAFRAIMPNTRKDQLLH